MYYEILGEFFQGSEEAPIFSAVQLRGVSLGQLHVPMVPSVCLLLCPYAIHTLRPLDGSYCLVLPPHMCVLPLPKTAPIAKVTPVAQKPTHWPMDKQRHPHHHQRLQTECLTI